MFVFLFLVPIQFLWLGALNELCLSGMGEKVVEVSDWRLDQTRLVSGEARFNFAATNVC